AKALLTFVSKQRLSPRQADSKIACRLATWSSNSRGSPPRLRSAKAWIWVLGSRAVTARFNLDPTPSSRVRLGHVRVPWPHLDVHPIALAINIAAQDSIADDGLTTADGGQPVQRFLADRVAQVGGDSRQAVLDEELGAPRLVASDPRPVGRGRDLDLEVDVVAGVRDQRAVDAVVRSVSKALDLAEQAAAVARRERGKHQIEGQRADELHIAVGLALPSLDEVPVDEREALEGGQQHVLAQTQSGTLEADRELH